MYRPSYNEHNERQCNHCGLFKNTNEFPEYRNSPDGLARRCNKCREKFPRPAKNRKRGGKGGNSKDYYLRDRYGIGITEYNTLLQQQEGVCAICRNTCSSGRELAVDHDHITDEIRGLLCTPCNALVGYWETRQHLIPRVEEYLKANKQKEVKSEQQSW